VKVIEVEDLHFSYDGITEVLKGINLVIEEGEIVAIMGENGAGKTTLIKHFNGILKPTRGSVRVLGLDTKAVPVSRLARNVGLIFQNPDHQIFAETVEEEIAFALKNLGFEEDYIRERVEWALKFMRLEKYRKSNPFTLSGGEKKRLTIASVLAYDPKIIVFDEPTIGQEYFHKCRLADFIKYLSSEGKTVIVVTHDVEFVAEHFPRTVVMANGRIVADGDTRDVLTDLEITKKARLIPPQSTQCAWLLKDLGVPERIILDSELTESIISIFKRFNRH